MQYPTHFIFNSDYPFDMIVYYKFYELTTDSNRYQTISFAHNLGFAPLLFGSWSDKKDFSTAYALLNEAYGADKIQVYVESDENNVYITRYQYTPVPSKKLYLKIYGFAPTSWTGDCAPTSQSSSELLLNTDNAYAPLLAAGAVQPKDLTQGGGQTSKLVAEVGKTGYQEITGRDNPVSLYYQEPLSPTIMLWKTTASTGRTEFRINTIIQSMGISMSAYPSATYNLAGAQGSGQMAISIETGSSRPGQANYNDITHFRVYG